MSVGNAVVPEPSSALSRSASGSAGGAGLKNGNGKVRSKSKLSKTTRSSSISFHTPPPPLKKCKRLGCSTCGRSPLTETFAYSSYGVGIGGGERQGNPVGKTVSKRADATAIVVPIEHESALDKQEELKDVEARCMPSECVCWHVREGAWKHKTSDKVTQWLEDSCQSSVTGISVPAGSSVCSESESRDMISSSEAGVEDSESYTLQSSSNLKPERVAADATSHKNNSTEQRLSGTIFAVPAEVKVSGSGWSTTTICGTRYSIRCLKLVLCLPVVLLGLYLRIRESSWEQYEPPPT